MEHVSPIQICAVTRSTIDGYDAVLRLVVADPGVPPVDVSVGTGYPSSGDALSAVIAYAAQRLRPQTVGGPLTHPDKVEHPPPPETRWPVAGSIEDGPIPLR